VASATDLNGAEAPAVGGVHAPLHDVAAAIAVIAVTVIGIIIAIGVVVVVIVAVWSIESVADP
jgi:hypothetical protein